MSSLGIKRKRTSSHRNHNDLNNGNDDIIPRQRISAASKKIAAIRTPSALLSRDPTHLSMALGAPLDAIKDIRARVAEGIIFDPYVGHGGHAAELVSSVTNYCMDGVGGDDNDKEAAEAGKEITTIDRPHRPSTLMAGAVTALDMCAQTLALENVCSQSQRGRINPSLGFIGTGSNAMDQLLAPDDAYSSFGNAWSIPFSKKIGNGASAFMNNDDDNVKHTSRGGVPFGMVTEFSGPPSSGKTQLALSITTHAASENKWQVHYILGGSSRKALSRRLFSMCLDLAQATAMQRWGLESSDGITNQIQEEAKSAALKALDRVSFASVPDAYSLLATLARIDYDEANRRRGGDDSAQGESGTLLVVDSVSGCVGHHLSGDKVGPALANQVALTLRQMARTHDGHLGIESSTTKSAQGSSSCMIQPRRFAVVVTNGSVAKRSSENESAASSKIIYGKPPQNNKPAMGRYWHVSDVGVWLEVDRSQSEAMTHPINFYDDSPIVGLSTGDNNVVCATLQNHIAKSCKSDRGQNAHGVGKLFSKFQIRAGGIADV